MARRVGVSRNTVTLAYQALVADGFLLPRSRSGFYVDMEVARAVPAPEEKTSREPPIEWADRLVLRPGDQTNISKPKHWSTVDYPFIYGQVDAGLFPIAEWRDCVRQAMEQGVIVRAKGFDIDPRLQVKPAEHMDHDRRPVGRKTAHDVAFGENARQSAGLVADDHRADALAAQQGDRLGDCLIGADRNDIGPFGVQHRGDSHVGGGRMDETGAFYRPAVLSNVNGDSAAVRNEIFGPVLTVQTFSSEEEAVSLAQHPEYGLCAGLFSKDLSRVIRVSDAIQAGTVWVNRYGRSRDHILPTGGFKNSGIGKDLGREAYKSNRRSKAILVDL